MGRPTLPSAAQGDRIPRAAVLHVHQKQAQIPVCGSVGRIATKPPPLEPGAPRSVEPPTPALERASAEEYARWYRDDAHRIRQCEAYESGYHHHRRLAVVCKVLRRLRVRQVLDLGCGDGWQTAKLIQAGFEIIGLDLAPERLRRARAHAQGAVGFCAADLRGLPLAPGSVECIYLGQVLEHLPEAGEALRGLLPILRPGGVLILDTPCRDNLIDDLLRISGFAAHFPTAIDWGLQLDPGHLHFFTLGEIRALLSGAGYEIVESRPAPQLRWNTPRVGNWLASTRRLWRIHDAVEALLAYLPRYRRTGAIVVCVARRPPGSPRES